MRRGYKTTEGDYDDDSVSGPVVLCPHGFDHDGICSVCDGGVEPCPGPAGLWPCVHVEGFGHPGDHVRHQTAAEARDAEIDAECRAVASDIPEGF